jgi:hypothetical protein
MRNGADANQVNSAVNGHKLLTTAHEQCNEATVPLLRDAGAHYNSLCVQQCNGY